MKISLYSWINHLHFDKWRKTIAEIRSIVIDGGKQLRSATQK
jgi:hypothetical protein